MSEMTENELKQAVKRIGYQNGWAIYHVPQAPMRNGGGKGYPDLTCARAKEVFWIELKTDIGALTPEQQFWRQILPAYHVIRPLDLAKGRVNELFE